MRAVSLADPDVEFELVAGFVPGMVDNSCYNWSGQSGRHAPGDPAVETTNAAGAANLQMVILAPDGTVLHCLPGFWHPEDLLEELRFARSLFAVWQDTSLSSLQKKEKFIKLHAEHVAHHRAEMIGRSHLQCFDLPGGRAVFQRIAGGNETARSKLSGIEPTADVLLHYLNSEQPLVHIRDYSFRAMVDYADRYYNKQVRRPEGEGQAAASESLAAPEAEQPLEPQATPEAEQPLERQHSSLRQESRAAPSGGLMKPGETVGLPIEISRWDSWMTACPHPVPEGGVPFRLSMPGDFVRVGNPYQSSISGRRSPALPSLHQRESSGRWASTPEWRMEPAVNSYQRQPTIAPRRDAGALAAEPSTYSPPAQPAPPVVPRAAGSSTGGTTYHRPASAGWSSGAARSDDAKPAAPSWREAAGTMGVWRAR